MKAYPTQERVRELFVYTGDEYTKGDVRVRGGLLWRPRFDSFGRPNTREVGRPAGTLHPRRLRIQVAIHGEDYELHRLIWIYHFGATDALIDHKSRDTTDNRIANLRECSHSGNNANRSFQGGSSKYVGVYKNARGKWVAQIKKNRKVTYLGSFDSEVAAARARDEATKRVHGEFGVLNNA